MLGGSWDEGAEAIWLQEAEIPGEHSWPRGSGEQGAWRTTLVAVWRTKREWLPVQPCSLGTHTGVWADQPRQMWDRRRQTGWNLPFANGYYVLLFKPIISSSPCNSPVKNFYFPYFINEKNWQDWPWLICLLQRPQCHIIEWEVWRLSGVWGWGLLSLTQLPGLHVWICTGSFSSLLHATENANYSMNTDIKIASSVGISVIGGCSGDRELTVVWHGVKMSVLQESTWVSQPQRCCLTPFNTLGNVSPETQIFADSAMNLLLSITQDSESTSLIYL